mgnify:CR=1 FL=1
MIEKKLKVTARKLICVLGIAGLVPFFLLVFFPNFTKMLFEPSSGLVVYGALILSFLGGAVWGLTLNSVDTFPRKHIFLIIAVVPSLLGWVCIFLPTRYGVFALICFFTMMLIIDYALYRSGHTESWYMTFRFYLTISVISILATAAFY